ncbi:unnamed protein product [Candida parapsilosis]
MDQESYDFLEHKWLSCTVDDAMLEETNKPRCSSVRKGILRT